MQKEKKRELYYKRKEAGLCVGCGKPNNNGKVYCDDCLEYHRWSNAKSVATASDEKREKRKAYLRAWKKAHKATEKNKAYQKAWKQAHKDRQREYTRKWESEHQEELKERRKEYNRRYREKRIRGEADAACD